MSPRALDLYCGGGGASEGLLRAGFDVVGVDLDPKRARAYNRGPGNPERHERPAAFIPMDALTFLDYEIERRRVTGAARFEFIWASPPCQAHSILRKLQPGREYPDLIPATRERLQAAGIPYAIENVPGAPLGGFLTLLCGTMFGLQTPDGRAELRRHRLFETSWPIALRPACQHGQRVRVVTGHTACDQRAINGRRRKVVCVGGGKAMSGGMSKSTRGKGFEEYQARRAISVTGNTAQTNTIRNTERETFSTDDARHAMGIDWMAMKDLSQAIPPAYAEWIGKRALEEIHHRAQEATTI